MRRPKFELIKTSCRRCGCELYTGSRSLFGADAAKAKYDRICDKCVTEQERNEMLNAQASAILRHSA